MQAPPPVPNLLNQLDTVAANIKSALHQAGIDWLRPAEDGGWSLTEVLCHLRDVEIEVHQARYQAILAQEYAFLAGVSADEWAADRGYIEQDGRKALYDFLEARRATIELLQGVSNDQWKRQGRHAFFGPTSMHEILFLQVRHDDIHLEQIRTLLEEQHSGMMF
jgi:hypothetical protein